MSILKCKMCGGDIVANAEQTFGTCDSCGTTSTLPKVSDEQRANLFNRANHFRRQNEFDKALAAFESILNTDPENAEAHWGVVLSRYGIEYVDDPVTHKKIPTCHRVQLNSILSDADYLAALEHSADGYTRSLYEEEANTIAQIQKGILDISAKEEPYDVFICYKETSEAGTRTKDSTLAQDVYYQLVNEGYKVFFSRITLEKKLGQEYEPYIFAALNSAKVMVVLGTTPEHFNALWVRNEWSRYLALMKTNRSKLLIPCYADMDGYDLPEALSMLQSQDMSKIGFMQDLIRGIRKVLEAGKAPKAQIGETADAATTPGVSSLLKRGNLFLEDKDWKSATEYFDRVLDIDPECAPAYMGKVCAVLNVSGEDGLVSAKTHLTKFPDYEKALRFASAAEKQRWSDYQKEIVYIEILGHKEKASTKDEFVSVAKEFREFGSYKDVQELALECEELAREAQYKAIQQLKSTASSEEDFKNVAEKFQEMGDYRDAPAQAMECGALAKDIGKKARMMAEQKKKAEEKRKRKLKKFAIIGSSAIAVVSAFIVVLTTVIIPSQKYAEAVSLMESGAYEEAISIFLELGDYKDSEIMILECNYQPAILLMESGAYEEAYALFMELDGYSDSEALLLESQYQLAVSLIGTETAREALSVLFTLDDYKNSKEILSSILVESNATTISTGVAHTVGLMSDGTMVAVGNNDNGETNIQDWTDIVSVSAGDFHTVGLRSDGTVIASGNNELGQTDVLGWTDIVSVSAGGYHTVGLRSDGTVVAVGYNDDGQLDVQNWTDIVAVSASDFHTVGLRSDGTVVAVGDNDDGKLDVQDWTNIVSVATGNNHTVGVMSDGMVVATGSNVSGQSNVQDWTDIVDISTGRYHTVGLRVDGTVVVEGNNVYGQLDVQDWTDIVAVSAGGYHTVGLRSDGTVVAVGDNEDSQLNVQDWTDIMLPPE